MKLKIFTILLIAFTFLVSATTKTTLEDILPPQFLSVDKDNLYLISGSTVSVFSLNGLKLIKSFGKKGEGPGEFILLGDDLGMTLDVETDQIRVVSRRKISYFSKKGDFVKEVKALNGFFHIPVEENFVALRFDLIDKIGYRIVCLYDKNFKKIKDIYKKKNWFQQGKMINPVTVRPPFYCSHKGKVFTENGNGNILIFNKKGEKVASSNLNITQVKVSEEDKKNYHYYYKTHPSYKNAYAQLKHLIKFPEFYPKIKFFDVSNSKIYVFTHVKKGNKKEVYVLDLNGKLIKKTYVDMPELNPQDVFPIIRVRNNKIYQIIENEDDEEAIDLYVSDIKI